MLPPPRRDSSTAWVRHPCQHSHGHPSTAPHPPAPKRHRRPRPPEMSCAPRDAPEPDSQSPKNTHRPSQPGQPTGTPATPALCRSQHRQARSLAAAQPRTHPNQDTQGNSQLFSMMTSNTRKRQPGHSTCQATAPARTQRLPGRTWWRRTGSNRRPPACKAGALPAELRPQAKTHAKPAAVPHTLEQGFQRQWWAREDSNLRPHAYQACALTN